MSLSTDDIPCLNATIPAMDEGSERWLMEVARLQIVLGESVPIEMLAPEHRHRDPHTGRFVRRQP
jgi:hypothetical protein